MDFISEIGNMYEYRINTLNIELIEAVTEFIESTIDDLYITEAKKDTIYTKVKKFFVDLIVSMEDFIKHVKIDVKKKIRDKKNEASLRMLHKKLKNSNDMYVEVVDYWAIKDYTSNILSKVKEYTKRVGKMSYKNTNEIEDDINKFNSVMDGYDKELEKLMNKKRKVPRKMMIEFIENEISGRSSILDCMSDAISAIEQMSSDVDSLEKRKDLLGPDVIPKHIGFLRKISMKISSMFRKWVSKIVSTIVFIFA